MNTVGSKSEQSEFTIETTFAVNKADKCELLAWPGQAFYLRGRRSPPRTDIEEGQRVRP